MIVKDSNSKAVLTGDLEVSEGTISLNKETFGLIIKGIYDDKVLASCREPIFNAVDAHIEANKKDVPIIIHPPTDLDPVFFVQDYGVGMPENFVRKTFMNLGESTKRNTNELVGNKGVGSKASFSMVDSFDVISTYNGIKSTYLVFLDNGIPKVTKLKEESTDESNGVRVQFHVDKKYVSDYRTAIVSCLRYAKFPFILTDPLTQLTLDGDKSDAQYTFEENGWKMNILMGYTSAEESRVVMGHQPYRSKYLESLDKFPAICVEIPIGDCNINPGREWTIEGQDDGGFGERLTDFVQKGISLRGAEVVKLLESTSTAEEAREVIRDCGVFGKIYGRTFLKEKFDKSFFGGNFGDCEVFGGGLNKGRIAYSTYRDQEFYAGSLLVFNDANSKYNRNKCNYLSEQTGKNVYFVRDSDYAELFKDVAQDPFFSGTVRMLSELPRRPSGKGSSTTRYEAGYWVKKLEKDGYFRRERILKSEFKKIKYCIPYEGDIQRGDCWLGQVGNLYQQNYDNIRSALGIPDGEDLYLVSETRLLWTHENCKYFTESSVSSLLEEDAWKFLLNRAANEGPYAVLKSKLSSIVKLQDFGEYAPHFHKWEGNTYWKYKHLNKRAQTIITNRIKCANAYIKKLESRYPLLQFIELKHWEKPAMIEYRNMMDSKRL